MKSSRSPLDAVLSAASEDAVSVCVSAVLSEAVEAASVVDVPAEELPQAAMESAIAAVSKIADNFFIFFIWYNPFVLLVIA